MDQKLIFLPVLAQVFLTMLVYIGITKAKIRAVSQGRVDESRRALYQDAWPEDVVKYTNNLRNQFESPVLFYVLCFVLWAIHAVDLACLTIAWAFVGSRIIHAYVHTGSNYVPVRKKVFMIGCVLLLVLAIYALVGVFSNK